MGFKRANYEVKDLGITLPTAYAQIKYLSVNIDGTADAMFEIQQSRDMITVNRELDMKHFSCAVDKTKPIYEQVYRAAKEDIFKDWEDDIIYETKI